MKILLLINILILCICVCTSHALPSTSRSSSSGNNTMIQSSNGDDNSIPISGGIKYYGISTVAETWTEGFALSTYPKTYTGKEYHDKVAPGTVISFIGPHRESNHLITVKVNKPKEGAETKLDFSFTYWKFKKTLEVSENVEYIEMCSFNTRSTSYIVAFESPNEVVEKSEGKIPLCKGPAPQPR